MFFSLELWANILRYTDTLATINVAKTCKLLYELIQIYVDKRLISPIPTIQITLEVYKVHASHKLHILSINLPIDCSIHVFKDSSLDRCSIYKINALDSLIALSFPDLRSPNQKVALIFNVSKSPEIEYKCLTSKLNMELHHNGIYQWWIGTNNVMITPKTKKNYR